MRSLVPVRLGDAVVDIAVPAPSGRMPGVSMAGFHGRADFPLTLQVIPYPALTVFVDFGQALLVDGAGGEQIGGNVLVGLAPGNVRGMVSGGEHVDCLQLRLSPVLAHAVFGPCSEVGEMVVGLDELWGRDAERTRERLRAAASWDDRFAIARAALTRRCGTGRTMDPEVAHIWRRMIASGGRARVERLADEVGWSRKRLWSRFRTQVGLTPKRAANLVRFDHAAHRLAAGHDAAVVAAESGFVDQSHLCRDAMSFTGMTPTALADAPWLSVDDVAWPVPAPERPRWM